MPDHSAPPEVTSRQSNFLFSSRRGVNFSPEASKRSGISVEIYRLPLRESSESCISPTSKGRFLRCKEKMRQASLLDTNIIAGRWYRSPPGCELNACRSRRFLGRPSGKCSWRSFDCAPGWFRPPRCQGSSCETPASPRCWLFHAPRLNSVPEPSPTFSVHVVPRQWETGGTADRLFGLWCRRQNEKRWGAGLGFEDPSFLCHEIDGRMKRVPNGHRVKPRMRRLGTHD
jgi:hypothetical protein